MGAVIDFPYFTIDHTIPGPVFAFDAEPLRKTLEACGFEVHRMPLRTGRFTGMLDGLPSYERIDTTFGVVLPESWHCFRRLIERGEEVEYLLDGHDQYRGWFVLGADGVPIIGELACRYHILWNPSCFEIPLAEPPESATREWLVVVDQAAFDVQHAYRYPVVVHHDFRWPVAITWPLELRIRYARAQALKRKLGEAPDWHPVQRWLTEHFPLWRDPSAYWE